MNGTVKFFSDVKGYGFLIGEGGGKDIFVHHTGIIGTGRRTLKEGENVTFDVITGEKGTQAVNVVKV